MFNQRLTPAEQRRVAKFEERGAHELKGVPGEWHLFAVACA